MAKSKLEITQEHAGHDQIVLHKWGMTRLAKVLAREQAAAIQEQKIKDDDSMPSFTLGNSRRNA